VAAAASSNAAAPARTCAQLEAALAILPADAAIGINGLDVDSVDGIDLNNDSRASRLGHHRFGQLFTSPGSMIGRFEGMEGS
jgi:hypothetical protein